MLKQHYLLVINTQKRHAFIDFSYVLHTFQQDGKSTAFGEDFQSVARQCYDSNRDQLLAVGINCVAPRLVESFFKGINDDREGCPVPLIVYPNSGETYKVELG